MKITEQGYRLPVLKALEPVQEFGSGVNKPVLMRCIDQNTGEQKEVVVKLRDGERMKEGNAHGKELMGAWLAKEMNIFVPDPCVVVINEELRDSQAGTEYYGRFSNSIGYCFGSDNLENLVQPGVSEKLNITQISDAQRIFVFDMIIMNPDRTFDKINLLTDGNHLYAIDHELAFHEIAYSLIPRQDPWKLNHSDIMMAEKSVVKAKIQGKKLNKEQLVGDLSYITGEFWAKAFELMPKDWSWEHWPDVSNFINGIVDHSPEFIDQIEGLVQ